MRILGTGLPAEPTTFDGPRIKRMNRSSREKKVKYAESAAFPRSPDKIESPWVGDKGEDENQRGVTAARSTSSCLCETSIFFHLVGDKNVYLVRERTW